MKTISRYIGFVMAAFAAMAISGCNKPDEGGEVLNEDFALTVDVEDVTATSAKVKVTHNGQKTDTWYGFLTDVVSGDEEDMIAAEVEKFMAGETDGGLLKSKSYVRTYKELNPRTAYKYIAFGLTADGKVYGAHASCEFETESASGNNPGGGNGGGNNGGNSGDTPGADADNSVTGGMMENSSWQVSYIGAGTIDGEPYDNVISVTSKDKKPYTVAVVYASEWDVSYLREMANQLVTDMKTYVNSYNQSNGTNFTIKDLLYTGNTYDAFDLAPGYYRAVAIGVTTDGRVSGYYQVSDRFEVKEATASDAYSAWLGNWTVVGTNGAEFNMTLKRGVANKTFYMTGWEDMDVEVEVEYFAEQDGLLFFSQLIAEGVDMGQYGKADIYFLGVDDKGYFYTIDEGEYYIAIGGVLDNGNRAIVRYGVGVSDYPQFSEMCFMGKFSDGWYGFSEKTPSFSAAMVASTAASAPKMKAGKVRTLPRSFSTFYPTGRVERPCRR